MSSDIMPFMTKHVVHISEAEATSNFADVLARVRAGIEVVIESGKLPVAVVRSAGDEFRPRLLSESIALAGCPRFAPRFWALTSVRMFRGHSLPKSQSVGLLG